MGMYDTVLVPCPVCGNKLEFQSKGGECCLFNYHLHEAPIDVLSDINRHSPYTCINCGTHVAVSLVPTPIVVKR